MITLHEIDAEEESLRHRAPKVKIVCIGDSITGWNNYGPMDTWPCQTFPYFMEEFYKKQDFVANMGVASSYSSLAPQLVDKASALFTKASHYIIEFGANDLAYANNYDETSRAIIENLEIGYNMLRDKRVSQTYLGVAPVNGFFFRDDVLAELKEARRIHNHNLAEWCKKNKVRFISLDFLTNDHLKDNLHPNREGARLIAKNIKQRLESKITKA
jgi:lysophospholipase L1-like esterase